MRILLLLVGFLCVGSVFAQNRALTRPFKYLRPTEETNSSIDPRKSPYVWRVYIDRQGVAVYSDQNLKNPTGVSPSFMEEFIVAGETREALLLYTDSELDSVRFSKSAQKIGWVSKDNLVLWDRFLWGSDLARQLVLATWEDIQYSGSSIQPSSFSIRPETSSLYYIFNVIKFDETKQHVLLSLRTFNHLAPDLFCWVNRDKLKFINERTAYVANRRMVGGNPQGRPFVYFTETGAVNRANDEVSFRINEVKPEEAFFPYAVEGKSIEKVFYPTKGNWDEGYINTQYSFNNENSFKQALLLNRQEFSALKRTIEILSLSENAEDMVDRWKSILSAYGVTFYESLGQNQLLEEIVGVRFNVKGVEPGSNLDDLLFIRTQDFTMLRGELEKTAQKISQIENQQIDPYNFAPLDYPHYLFPLDVLPFEFLGKQYNTFSEEFTAVEEVKWDYSKTPVSYNSFDIFYVENSHNYGTDFESKDQVIKTFYRAAARIRPNEMNRSAFVFFSNIQKPFTGAGADFVESVAGMMREGVVSRPNRFNDKKLIRSALYAKNITQVENLRIHFFVGERFYEEAQQSNRWLLKELVTELHEEFNVKTTEVILYSIIIRENLPEFYNKINKNVPEGITYRVSTINL